MVDQFQVDVKAVKLTVYDFGGEGKPVLFSHAASFCGMMWKPVIDKLGQQFRVFSVDMRGHGSSIPLDPKMMRWDAMSHDLSVVAKEVKKRVGSGDPIAAVGHSMGGTCLLMAALAEEGLLSKLWAYEPILFSEGAPERAEVIQMLYEGTLRRKPSFDSAQIARQRFSSKPPMDEFKSEVLDLFIEYGLSEKDQRVWLNCTPEVEAAVYLGAGTGVTAKFSDIDFDVRFVVGDDDGDRVPAILGLSEYARTEIHQLDSLGHFGPFVDPSRVAGSISDWLG